MSQQSHTQGQTMQYSDTKTHELHLRIYWSEWACYMFMSSEAQLEKDLTCIVCFKGLPGKDNVAENKNHLII